MFMRLKLSRVVQLTALGAYISPCMHSPFWLKVEVHCFGCAVVCLDVQKLTTSELGFILLKTIATVLHILIHQLINNNDSSFPEIYLFIFLHYFFIFCNHNLYLQMIFYNIYFCPFMRHLTKRKKMQNKQLKQKKEEKEVFISYYLIYR